MSRLRLSLLTGFVFAAVAACSSGDNGAESGTNWLGPLVNYERAVGEAGNGIYILKTGPSVAAERIRLARAEITVSERSDLNSILPSVYEKIRAQFEDALARALSKQPVDTKPEAGTYIVRIALTNLTAERIGKREEESALEDLKFSFDGAAIEAELRDRRTNTRHAVIVIPAKAGASSSRDLTAIFAKFADQISERIATARTELTNRSRTPPAKPTAEK